MARTKRLERFPFRLTMKSYTESALDSMSVAFPLGKPVSTFPGNARKDLARHHVKLDGTFAEACLRDGIDAMHCGYLETGKTMLRDPIKAAVGLEKPGQASGVTPNRLIRTFGPRGSRRADDPFSVSGYLQRRAGMRLDVSAGRS